MADEHQAEVECGYCHQRQWIAWDLRYDDKSPRGNRFSQIKCKGCQGAMRYTGQMRGEVETGPRQQDLVLMIK